MKRRTRRAASLPLVLALAVPGCGGEEPERMSVHRVVPVETRDIVVSASAAGAVEPIQAVEVKSKASGEIVAVNVEVGDVVEQGDLLVRVDPRVPENALVQAEADLRVANAELANAESQLRRSEALHESQVITEEEWETTRLAYATAEARQIRAERVVQDARIAFEDTEVRAPTDGVILSREVEVGSVIQSASFGVSGGSVLLTMANLDTVQVRTLVDETDIGKIASGQSVSIVVEAFPNQPFEGEVLKVEPQAVVEQNVTMFPVLVRIANQDGLLKPGMNAEVEITVADRQDVVAVPNGALRTVGDVETAAQVLGLDLETVGRQLAAGEGEPLETRPTGVDGNGATAGDGSVDGSGAGARPRSARRAAAGWTGSGFEFGGEYIVFVSRAGAPTAVRVRTGVTDLDHSEVLSGLSAGDSVYILPTATLVEEQRERRNRIQERTQLLGGGS